MINLATQAFIAAYSKTPHFDPADPEAHLNIMQTDGFGRDVIGLIRAICVKVIFISLTHQPGILTRFQERSSAKRKELFRSLQLKTPRSSVTGQPLQLLMDMPVRWSSTYVMLCRALLLRTVRSFCLDIPRFPCAHTAVIIQYIDDFVDELARQEPNRERRRKLDDLKLDNEEWE